MKRVQVLIIIGVFILILIGCSSVRNVESDPEEIERLIIHANYIVYEEESELFDAAELVVIARTSKSFKDREHVVRYNDTDTRLPPIIAEFYTKTQISIYEVLKQPDSSSLSKDDKITILEPISLLKNESDIKKITYDNYVEIEEGKYYIIYLKDNTYGEYGVINMNNGRFNIEGDDNLYKYAHENDIIEDHEIMKRKVMTRFEKEIMQILNK